MPPVPLDWMLVSRYALLISLVNLLPIPVVDWVLDTWLRRRLTRLQLRAYELTLPSKDVRMLGDANTSGCVGLVVSVAMWPFRRALRYFIWVLLVKSMVDTFSDVVHRAVLVHEAAGSGLLQTDTTVHLRAAMQRATKTVNTKPLERAIGIVFRSTKGSLWGLLALARKSVRKLVGRDARRMDLDDRDVDPLNGALEPLSEALARAIWLPEIHERLRTKFHEELAQSPQLRRPNQGSLSEE
jgi:hypothetical protein